MEQDEGYIKFQLEWEQNSLPSEADISELVHWRNILYQHHLIGMYENGIDYGNISCRYKKEQFIISGTQTGGKAVADPSDFTLVTDFDMEKNKIYCQGPVKASSESMTHAAAYQADIKINAVVHVHHHNLWQKFLHKSPTTAENIPYGTPEMAKEIQRIILSSLDGDNIIIMAGHDDGLISLGKNISSAAKNLLQLSA